MVGMNVITGKPLRGFYLDLTNIPQIKIFNYGGMPDGIISLLRAAKAGKI
jgi:hypothetical protein